MRCRSYVVMKYKSSRGDIGGAKEIREENIQEARLPIPKLGW